MRKSYETQRQFGCCPIYDLELNLNCRDEIVPILAALQHLFTQPLSQIAASKSPKAKATLPAAYENLLNRANVLLERAKALLITEKTAGIV